MKKEIKYKFQIAVRFLLRAFCSPMFLLVYLLGAGNCSKCVLHYSTNVAYFNPLILFPFLFILYAFVCLVEFLSIYTIRRGKIGFIDIIKIKFNPFSKIQIMITGYGAFLLFMFVISGMEGNIFAFFFLLPSIAFAFFELIYSLIDFFKMAFTSSITKPS